MSTAEWWAEFDSQVIQSRRIEEISSGKSKGGGFSRTEWEAARAKHKAKMNDRT
jgi:hypothetical protein